MKIIALAIYKYDGDNISIHDLKKFKSAQKSLTGFFSYDPIKNFENKILPKIFRELNNEPSITYNDEHEFFYLKYDKVINSIYLIISERKLETAEAGYLFHNMGHVNLREDKLKVSLQNMVDNPLNYIGKDIFVGELRGNLDNFINTVLVDVKQKLNERGENLANLQEKTIILSQDAQTFAIQSKKMNKCCSWGS